MESLNALIQGMGLMHLGIGQAIMLLVSLLQLPIMKALTNDKERKISMVRLRTVSKREKILFPAVPMAARVSNKVGLESDAQNFLLMHAMGPNVAGVIGSAIASRLTADLPALVETVRSLAKRFPVATGSSAANTLAGRRAGGKRARCVNIPRR